MLENIIMRLFVSDTDSFIEEVSEEVRRDRLYNCLLYTSPSPRDLSTSRMPSSA